MEAKYRLQLFTHKNTFASNIFCYVLQIKIFEKVIEL